MIRVRTTVPNFDKLFYDQLQFSEKLGSTILIEGSAGSGKTTLSLQLLCDFIRPNGLDILPRETEGKDWSEAKRLAVYVHLEEDIERMYGKIDAFNLLRSNDQEVVDVIEDFKSIHSHDRVLGFINGDYLDAERERWRQEEKNDDPDDLLPFEPRLRARDACIKEQIRLESDYDAMSMIIRRVLRKVIGAGRVLVMIVIDNLNSLDTFEILDEETVWDVRQKYTFLRTYIQRYAMQLNEQNENTDILPLACIFVGDEPRSEDRSPRNQVEYVSDAYIRLSGEEIGDQKYSARTIEVVKASNLPHVRGKQSFAIQYRVGECLFITARNSWISPESTEALRDSSC